jgi:AraC-like DNA-binding protein
VSISRHSRSLVRSYSITHPAGIVTLPTRLGWDRIVYAHRGLFTAHTDGHAWTIPAHRAICLPDGVAVRIETARRVAIRCLYADRDLQVLGPGVRVVTLQPLTRELLAHAVTLAPMSLDRQQDDALLRLLADRLGAEPDEPLHLPLPNDGATLAVAAAISTDPARAVDEHLRRIGVSRRTADRRFASETGMSLGRWRRRRRILAALSMLTDGDSVTTVAMRVGYATPSSFVAAFRAELGSAPGEYLRRRQTTAVSK